MFASVRFGAADARMLVDVAGWVGAPGSRVAEARAALAAREDAQSAFCAGEPAVPTLEACGKLRAAFASLVASCRQTGHLQAILTGADHQLPSEVAAAFRRTLVSSHDPAAEEQALAVQQAGRAVAGAREWQQSSGGFPRTAVFVCCMGLEAIRRVVSEPDGRLSFSNLRFLHNVAAEVFESPDPYAVLRRGLLAAQVSKGGLHAFDALSTGWTAAP